MGIDNDDYKRLEERIKSLEIAVRGTPDNGGGMKGKLQSQHLRLQMLEKYEQERHESWVGLKNMALDKIGRFILTLLFFGALVAIIFYVKAPSNILTGGNISIPDLIPEPVSKTTPRKLLTVRDVVNDYQLRTGDMITADTVRRWIHEGRLRPMPVKVHGIWYIDPTYVIEPKQVIEIE